VQADVVDLGGHNSNRSPTIAGANIDLDLDVDETTARLYNTLTSTDPSPAARSIRLSS
jgi:hypothetical protein